MSRNHGYITIGIDADQIMPTPNPLSARTVQRYMRWVEWDVRSRFPHASILVTSAISEQVRCLGFVDDQHAIEIVQERLQEIWERGSSTQWIPESITIDGESVGTDDETIDRLVRENLDATIEWY